MKLTETVQLAPGATELGQFGVAVKSVPLGPVTAIPLMFRGVVPMFFKVSVFAALVPTFKVPKLRISGLKPAIGLITFADKLTCCGLPEALSTMLRVASDVSTSSAR
jgi:hypothetical protein